MTDDCRHEIQCENRRTERPNFRYGPRRVAAWSTAIALVLGSLAAGALARTRFFGREVISLLLILPIALPADIRKGCAWRRSCSTAASGSTRTSCG